MKHGVILITAFAVGLLVSVVASGVFNQAIPARTGAAGQNIPPSKRPTQTSAHNKNLLDLANSISTLSDILGIDTSHDFQSASLRNQKTLHQHAII
jgi:hypothetical protein